MKKIFNKIFITSFIIILVCVSNAFTPKRNLQSENNLPDKIIGADISFLPELESKGMKFYEDGVQKDPITILKEHGFNFIRLRIFNDPAQDSGYSPKLGFCDLKHTLLMAKRAKAAGMGILIDFHYSDYWADDHTQFKPAAWKGLNFKQTTQALHDFTYKVIEALKVQNTLPDMVQIGNEINEGMVWPDGNISHPDTLAAFFKAGINAAKEVDPSIKIMLHIALGGQNARSILFLNTVIQRNVPFDFIGESYYPQWHGTLQQLHDNLTDLAKKYKQDIIVAEYTFHKQEVNDIVFNLPNNKGKGTFIWEPLNTWEQMFDKNGNANDSMLHIYDNVVKKYEVK